ncbi:MAG: hypothetical protein QM695_04475 [Micropruina sp.]
MASSRGDVPGVPADLRAPPDILLGPRPARSADDQRADRGRKQRCAITLGLDGRPWRPDLALQRDEVLQEDGLVGVNVRQRQATAH